MFRWNGVYSESKLLANHQGFFSFNVAIQRSAESTHYFCLHTTTELFYLLTLLSSRVTNLCFNDGL